MRIEFSIKLECADAIVANFLNEHIKNIDEEVRKYANKEAEILARKISNLTKDGSRHDE